MHQQSSISTDNLSRAPRSVRRAQHARYTSYLMYIRRPASARLGLLNHLIRIDAFARAHQRRMLNPTLDASLELFAVGSVHGPLNGTRVNGIHRSAFAQLTGPNTRHSLDGGFGAAVDGLAEEAAVGRDGREVNDPAGAVGGEVWNRSFHEQEGAQDIDVIGCVKVLELDIRYLVVPGNAGIVDEDVDLEFGVRAGRRREKVVLCGGDEGRGPVGGTQVGLHAISLDAVFRLQLFGQVLCERGRGLGGVVDDDVATFGGQVLCDG